MTNYLIITAVVIIIITLMNFNFTKSKKNQKSLIDVLNENPKFKEMREIYEAMKEFNEDGTDQDEMPEGIGEFGHEATNPIPVNTIMGSISYLNKLRTSDGIKVTYIRTGSTSVPNIKRIIDKYQIFVNENEIASLFICPYNKKNSEKAPKGFKIAPFK